MVWLRKIWMAIIVLAFGFLFEGLSDERTIEAGLYDLRVAPAMSADIQLAPEAEDMQRDIGAHPVDLGLRAYDEDDVSLADQVGMCEFAAGARFVQARSRREQTHRILRLFEMLRPVFVMSHLRYGAGLGL